MMLEQLDKNKRRIKQKNYSCSFRAAYIAENYVYSTDTFSSVVAAWNADQKNPGSNILCILLFIFISNLKDVGLNPENSKSIKLCLHK